MAFLGAGVGVSSKRPFSRFGTHPRWLPVKKSSRSRRSYGKIGDCEQSTIMQIPLTKQVTGRAYIKVNIGELRRTMPLLFKPSKVIAL